MRNSHSINLLFSSLRWEEELQAARDISEKKTPNKAFFPVNRRFLPICGYKENKTPWGLPDVQLLLYQTLLVLHPPAGRQDALEVPCVN